VLRRIPRLPLLLLSALLLTAATPPTPPAPPPPPQTFPDPAEWLRSGPMLGPSETTETSVWLQTRRPCRVQVRFWEQGRPETARLSDAAEAMPATDLIARLRLSGLRFGTRYEYEVYLDGLRVARPYPLAFHTQPLWRYRTPPPDVRIATGSCAYINDPAYDRPGEPYGGDYRIFRAIAAQHPDLMVWLGDDIYYREGDLPAESGMRARWAHDRALPELQPLLGSVHQVAMWDDHDYGPNDSDRTFSGRETSLRVFRDYWLNETYGTPETPGVYQRVEQGDVELFLLDDRFYRSPDDLPAGPDKRMLGAAQLRWLEESLSSSHATFKIVANGNQMFNPMNTFEGLGRYPDEQRELLDFLRRAKIEGVVFLTGDRHAAELLKVEQPGLYPLYELTSSPLTSGNTRNDKEANNPSRVPGTWVPDHRNFGMLEVTGPEGARVLTLRALDPDGKELWRHEVREGELKFPQG
jgi:alkaline phosphatase D